MSGSEGKSGGLPAALALLVVSLILVVVWLNRDAARRPDALVGLQSAADFTAQLKAMVAAGDTGRQIDGMPVVHVRPGDAYVTAQRWQFYPALELEPGQSYHLHIQTVDTVHSAAVDGREALLVPNVPRVIEITTKADGQVSIQCGEYCGLNHTKMIGHISIAAAGQP